MPADVASAASESTECFWDQGFPALMLTDTSYLRNPHYHEPTDTPETLDYDRMASVTLGVAGAMRRLARARSVGLRGDLSGGAAGVRGV